MAWVLGFLALGIGISFSLAFGDPPSDRGEQSISDDAELYMVNNTSCAMSGSTIDPEDLGRYQSFVRYDGPDERYRGKTLVFNQCCEMCITSFPEKWALERDDIMIDLGLVEATP